MSEKQKKKEPRPPLKEKKPQPVPIKKEDRAKKQIPTTSIPKIPKKNS